MRKAWIATLGVVLMLTAVPFATAVRARQAPAGRGQQPAPAGPRPNVGAADRHRVDPAAADRGRKTYAAECVTCHGPSARGTERGANLVRSQIVLRDRYGNAIGPLLKKGHPMQTGASSTTLTDAQITDLSHFIWQRINDTLRGSDKFEPGDVLVGDVKAGEAFFNGEGRCATCHSPTGDLAGYGKRYQPVDIQQRFVFPNTAGGRGRGRAAGPSRQQVTATVTLPDGSSVTGPLVSIDDFHVALRDSTGTYRSWPRTSGMKIVKNDPLAAHVELLDRLTDKQMHDVVAYLESLK
jgi:cytochrome c oxidase cbb3-type subunit III